MNRRAFLILLSGAAAWPFVARAQQAAMPLVGFLNHGMPDDRGVRAVRMGLSQAGYVEGRNVAIETRWAHNEIHRLSELADDLVRRGAAVIVTAISTPAALAAKRATATTPIVFGVGSDPVEAGLVSSYNRPGGNVTGIAIRNWELGGKRLALLHELSPGALPLAVLVNPEVPAVTEAFMTDVQATARSIGRRIEVFHARNPREIDSAFVNIVAKQPSALLVAPDLLYNNRRAQLVTLASRHAVPTIYPWREAVEIGGLMSYGPSFEDVFRRAGAYAGRVLKGEKPADLPVEQPTKFEFVINLQTSKTLGLEIPPTLLARADEVIE